MSALEPSEVEHRRAARERALELLYEAELKGVAIAELVDALPLPPTPLADELVRGVDANRDEIDELVARLVAPRWSLQRLAAVDRAILRLGSYELMKASDRSQAVIINEAVVLARRFGTDDSARFVNGVLSAVAAEVRPRVKTAPSVDALVIDLDGVIRHWDMQGLAASERAMGLDEGAIADAAFDADRLDRAMRGMVTFAEWAAEIGAAVREAHGADAAAVAAAFTDVGWRIDQLVMELVDEARHHVPVALLSNASSRLHDDLRRSDIADHFDAAIASADLGVVKPELNAFRAAADRLGVALDRCLYVDDTEPNVVAAGQLGMRAVRFVDVDQLAGDLAAAGLVALDSRS
ncbi:MAG: transcription antitermination factor NusB [Acidimicrobiales bacterium]